MLKTFWEVGERIRDDRYQIKKRMSGAQGVFYSVWDHQMHTPVGIKVNDLNYIMKLKYRGRNRELVKIARECYISLIVPDHPNLMRFYSTEFDFKTRSVINFIEVIPGTSLYDKFCNIHPTESVQEKIRYIIQIIESLLYLNEQFSGYDDIIKLPFGNPDGFYHGDLHSENIIITPDGRAVLIDWGQSYRFFNREEIYPAISPDFHAGSDYSDYRGTKIDVFSLGVMMWSLLFGGIPYGRGKYRNSIPVTIEDIIHRKINTIDLSGIKLQQKTIDLVHAMVSYEPSKRPSLSGIWDTLLQELKVYDGENVKKEHLYFMRHPYPEKNNVMDVSNSLFGLSKTIGSFYDRKLKAQVLELSIRYLNDHGAVFGSEDVAVIDKYIKDIEKYMRKNVLWMHTSRSIDYYRRQFKNPDVKIINQILFTLNKLVNQYISSKDINWFNEQFYRFYKTHPFRHFVTIIFINQLANVLITENSNADSIEKEFIKLLISVYSYITDKINSIQKSNIIKFTEWKNELNYLFTYFYQDCIHELEMIESPPDELRKIILYRLRLLIPLMKNIFDKENFSDIVSNNHLIYLIKFLEFGYYRCRIPGGNVHVYFHEVFNSYYQRFINNYTLLPDEIITYQTWSQYISWLLYFMISNIDCNIIDERVYIDAIDKINKLTSIASRKYIELELDHDINKLFVQLQIGVHRNILLMPVFLLVCDRLGYAINNEFIHYYSIFKEFYIKINMDHIELIEILASPPGLDMDSLNKLLSSYNIKSSLADRINKYHAMKSSGITISALSLSDLENNPELIDEYNVYSMIENKDLINAGRYIREGLLLNDSTDVLNVKRMIHKYHLLIRILMYQKQYEDVQILQKDIMLIINILSPEAKREQLLYFAQSYFYNCTLVEYYFRFINSWMEKFGITEHAPEHALSLNTLYSNGLDIARKINNDAGVYCIVARKCYSIPGHPGDDAATVYLFITVYDDEGYNSLLNTIRILFPDEHFEFLNEISEKSRNMIHESFQEFRITSDQGVFVVTISRFSDLEMEKIEQSRIQSLDKSLLEKCINIMYYIMSSEITAITFDFFNQEKKFWLINNELIVDLFLLHQEILKEELYLLSSLYMGTRAADVLACGGSEIDFVAALLRDCLVSAKKDIDPEMMIYDSLKKHYDKMEIKHIISRMR